MKEKPLSEIKTNIWASIHKKRLNASTKPAANGTSSLFLLKEDSSDSHWDNGTVKREWIVTLKSDTLSLSKTGASSSIKSISTLVQLQGASGIYKSQSAYHHQCASVSKRSNRFPPEETIKIYHLATLSSRAPSSVPEGRIRVPTYTGIRTHVLMFGASWVHAKCGAAICLSW